MYRSANVCFNVPVEDGFTNHVKSNLSFLNPAEGQEPILASRAPSKHVLLKKNTNEQFFTRDKPKEGSIRVHYRLDSFLRVSLIEAFFHLMKRGEANNTTAATPPPQ